jgi:hypothetical protein
VKPTLHLILMLITLLVCSTTGQSQVLNSFSKEKIAWTSSSFVDLLSGEEVKNSTSTFITDRGRTLEWLQSNEVRYKVRIDDLGGAWEDLDLNGYVSFKIVLEDYEGTVQIERQGEQLTLTIELTRDSAQFNHVKNQYTITEFKLL